MAINYKDKLIQDLINLKESDHGMISHINFKNKNENQQYQNINAKKIENQFSKNTEHINETKFFFSRNAKNLLKKNKYNYNTFDPKKEDIFKSNEIEKCLETYKKEDKNLKTHYNINNRDKKLNQYEIKDQDSLKANCFMQKSIKNIKEVTVFDQSKYYSEKINSNCKQ